MQHFPCKECYERWWYKRLWKFVVAMIWTIFKRMSTYHNPKIKVTWKNCEQYNKISCHYWWKWSYANLPSLFTNMKIKQTTLRYNTKHLQGIDPMGLGYPWWPFGQHLPTQLQTWITRGTDLKPINILIATGEIKKTGTLATTSHKSAR